MAGFASVRHAQSLTGVDVEKRKPTALSRCRERQRRNTDADARAC